MAGSAAFAAALFGIRTADAGRSLFFCMVQVEHNPADDGKQNGYNNKIDHVNSLSFELIWDYLLAFSAFSAAIFFSVLIIIPTITPTMPRIAIRPAIAAPAFREAASVISVPMV